ncbi:MAG: hypothetical protein LAO51_00365 [Acidobacteriia bacterium]|nr:hypothetical protein [Terriglobia bacterium]
MTLAARAAAGLAVLACAGALRAMPFPDAPSSAVPDPSALDRAFRQMLDASAIVEAEDRNRVERALDAVVRRVDRSVAGTRSPRRRARRMHRALHDTLFLRYDARADGIDSPLDRGRYNCVSAVLLEGLVASRLGFEARVVESPTHLSLRLLAGGETVDVDSVSPEGFDTHRDLRAFERLLLAYKLATPGEIRRRGLDTLFDEFNEVTGTVDLASAVAYLWHNAGERAVEEGRGLEAARCFLEAHRTHPGLGARDDSLPSLLARAFRIEYDAGRFEAANRVAIVENAILPGRTGARDRLLASAIQRIEAAAERGETALAEILLRDTDAVSTFPEDRVKLEREACPQIVAASLREGDWIRARRMIAVYLGAGGDPEEAAALSAWADRRQAGPAPPRAAPAPSASRAPGR